VQQEFKEKQVVHLAHLEFLEPQARKEKQVVHLAHLVQRASLVLLVLPVSLALLEHLVQQVLQELLVLVEHLALPV
jgi:hypothetical protein